MFLTEKLYTYDAPSLFGEASLQGKQVLILSPTHKQAHLHMNTFAKIWNVLHPGERKAFASDLIWFPTGGNISYATSEEHARGLTPDIVVISQDANSELRRAAEQLASHQGGRVVHLNTL